MRLNPNDRRGLPPGWLPDDLPVVRVLYEAECPIVYLSQTTNGLPLLAYFVDETDEGALTLLSPISAPQLQALERGVLPVRDALISSWLWAHVYNGSQSSAWITTPSDLPDDYLPLAGTPLLPEHEPVLRTRAVGRDVVLGRMPASVVAFVADATRKAVKTLLDFVVSAPSEGRPPEGYRSLYDLPIQRFAFNSFELSFAAPDDDLFPRTDVDEAADKLESGLVWAQDSRSYEPLLSDRPNAERAAILRAALLLTPPASGPITEVHVSGQWLPGGTVRLTRESRRKVRQELRTIVEESFVIYTGRIGELDVDKRTFILRDSDDGRDHKGIFEEDDLERILLYVNERVFVLGTEREDRLNVEMFGPERSLETHTPPA